MTRTESGIEAERVCSKCGTTKPIADYYKNSKGARGYSTWCKVCHGVMTRANYLKDPAKANAATIRWQKANKERVRANQNRLRHEKRDEYLEKGRAREAKPEYKAARATYRETHDAERKAYNAAYREAHREELRAYNRAYYHANKERVGTRIKEHVARKPDHYRALHARWKQENKDAVNASTHRRRARLKHNGGTWTDKQWQRVKARQNWRCLMCGKQEKTDGITLCADHIIPLSRGGWNIEANLQALCRSCNSKKHRKVLDLRHTQ